MYIIGNRIEVTRDSLPEEWSKVRLDEVKEDQDHVYFFEQSFFENHVKDQYQTKAGVKTDKKSFDITPNDIIRLFGIAALECNCDHLQILGTAKATCRSQIDSSGQWDIHVFND